MDDPGKKLAKRAVTIAIVGGALTASAITVAEPASAAAAQPQHSVLTNVTPHTIAAPSDINYGCNIGCKLSN